VLAIALAASEATDGLVDPSFTGTHLDLNGVVKGLAVDEALALIPGDGFVSAGGDMCVRGSTVVGLPGGGTPRLCDGGLATSGTTRWPDHLVDPRTRRASASCWSEPSRPRPAWRPMSPACGSAVAGLAVWRVLGPGIAPRRAFDLGSPPS
jgi:hypothetical protein